MMRKGRRTIVAIAAGVLCAVGLRAGSLTPPGAPAPTMHTLEELYQKLTNALSEVQSSQQRLESLEKRLEAAGMAGEVQPVSGMAFIPAGPFEMGNCMTWHDYSLAAETPLHTVYVSAFYMDRFLVTKALWDEVATWAQANGYDITVGGGAGKFSIHPVQSVSWHECVKWCNARSEKEGLPTVYRYVSGLNFVVYRTGQRDSLVRATGGYRLPTEAEWEKAARGGVFGRRFPWSDATVQHQRANYKAAPSSYTYDTSPTTGYHPDFDVLGEPYTSPSAAFQPNEYGLYDMAGNVLQWCWDWYSSDYYSSSPGSNPTGPTGPLSSRVARGGSWFSNADELRCSSRRHWGPSQEISYVGFRCARGL